MKKSKIWAPKGAKYLSDFMTELPVNCILNKHITGCGATELAIRNQIDTIIAMPYVSLVKNKSIYRRDNISVLGVYGGISKADIEEYARQRAPLKIASTYDSIPKVIQTLEAIGRNPYKDMFLLVDEWHTLFNSYLFRNNSIRQLLKHVTCFDKSTYLSATPIDQEYILEELKHLPTCDIIWPDKKQVNVCLERTNNPIQQAIVHCRRADTAPYNLHFFINSVESIRKIIDGAKLKPECVKVVCAQSQRNVEILGEEYHIQQASDPIKKFTFYTSTCFEGSDVYDDNGLTIIVSEGAKSNTLNDISTSFTQICGRIRDSKYQHEIIHIYSTTKYSSDVTFEEFKNSTYNAINEAKLYACEINGMSESTRVRLFKQLPYCNEDYINIEDNKMIVDCNLANLDIVNFKRTRVIYNSTTNLQNELANNGYTISSQTYNQVLNKLESSEKNRMSFKELFDEYVRLKTCKPVFSFEFPDQLCAVIERKYELVKDAYEILGPEKVQEMKYNVSNIKRAITHKLDSSVVTKIISLIDLSISHNEAIPVSRIKAKLKEIYAQLNIKATAKASDLSKWYDVKHCNKTIDGKASKCMAIIRKKLLIK